MTDKCIAEEELRGVTRDNVLALVSDCVEGMGYTTGRLFPDGSDGVSEIALFSRLMMESVAKDGTLAPALGVVTITTLGALPGVRVTIHCMVDWQTTGYHPGFTPCEVGAAIIRFLLRMVEGVECANAWRAPWELQEVRAVSPSKPSRNRPGRHVDPENKTAYSLIVEGGNTEEAADKAFEYWYRAKGIKRPTQKDRDNFNISMKRAEERARRPNLPTE